MILIATNFCGFIVVLVLMMVIGSEEEPFDC